MNEAELLKLAEKEILGEAKKAAVRYSVSGPSGWKPCTLAKTNKRFLVNTIMQTMSSNRIKDKSSREKKDGKMKKRKLLRNKDKDSKNSDNFTYNSPKKAKDTVKQLKMGQDKQIKCKIKLSNKMHTVKPKCI